MQMALFETRMMQVGRYAALAALFCVPISVAAVNFFAALIAICVLFNPCFWRESVLLWRIPTVKASLYLIIALSVSTLYSSASFADATNFALKEQKKLLLIPLVIWLFRDADMSKKALWILAGVLLLTLLFSYFNYAFVMNTFGSKNYNPQLDPSIVFHNRITQGMLMALLCGIMAWNALVESSRKPRIVFVLLALLAAINVTLMNNGRSGQLALMFVALYLLFEVMRLRTVSGMRKITIALIGVSLLAGLFALAVQKKNSRIDFIQQEIAMGAEGSSGQRIAFYKLSLELIKERPIFGFGAGSLFVESQRLVNQKRTELTWAITNPHNEYLLMGVHMGVVGIGFFLWLIYTIFAASSELPQLERGILRTGWVIFVGISGVNSLLLDFVDGHMFILLTGILLAPLYTTKAKVPLVA